MPYCIYCGHNVPEGASFCTACGAPLKKSAGTATPAASGQANAQTPTPPPPPSAAGGQAAATPPPPSATSGQGATAPPPPPPSPSSRPGAFRMTIQRKPVAQPPSRNMTPPPSAASQRNSSKPRKKSGGSSAGGCFRRVLHWATAGFALFASLSWGLNSLFPNWKSSLSSGPIGIFSSCSGGDHGGGLFGGEKKDDVLSRRGYEQALAEIETLEIIEKSGFPLTDEDHGLGFGTYSGEKIEGHTVAFLFEPTDNEDKRVVAEFTMLGDGKPVRKGLLCYCGHSIYCVFNKAEDIGKKTMTDVVVYGNPDGKSFSVYDKGDEKMKWSLEE